MIEVNLYGNGIIIRANYNHNVILADSFDYLGSSMERNWIMEICEKQSTGMVYSYYDC